jgi:hypothetical protein
MYVDDDSLGTSHVGNKFLRKCFGPTVVNRVVIFTDTYLGNVRDSGYGHDSVLRVLHITEQLGLYWPLDVRPT